MSKISISKAFNREDENLLRFNTINEATFRASVKRGFAIFLFWPITDLLQHALLLSIIAVGTWQVERGLALTTFIMFIILIGYFYWPMINVASNYHQFQIAAASIERIANVSEDTKIWESSTGTLSADDIQGNIQFSDVCFSYDGTTEVLNDISFSIRPGERVALVGHTGAGKSTIASLMVRFYDITKGSITVDGVDLKEYDLESLRNNISLVSQRVLLFKGTVKENLQVANSDATEEDMWEVLDQVQAREFIELLPNGLDSIIEENGKNLSVGQKQMISFARALLSDPKIIILDEATSAMDLYTETKIQDAIDTLLSSRTSISIAHRLTTILKSDKIIVLEDGKIVQMGTHQELVEQGQYGEMYKLYLSTQSAKYLEKIKVK
jgi:ATP-binding cassette, subfamily B, multidrug efflux pump